LHAYRRQCAALQRLFQRAAHGPCKPFNFSARNRFRDAHQRVFRQLGIVRAKHVRSDYFFAQKLCVHDAHRAGQLHREFIEEWRRKRPPHAWYLFQFTQRELRFREILFGHFPQAFLAQQCQVYGGCQGAKRLIGADIRGGLLAADVLLAGGER